MMNGIWEYIYSDYYRYHGVIPPKTVLGKCQLVREALCSDNWGFRYSFLLRLCSRPNPWWRWAHRRLKSLSVKLGVWIPASVRIGYGLYIGHPTSIVINEGTIMGNNVNIGQMLSIGSNKGTPARIGNNVYIGPGVCLVEDVEVGDDVIIGAGSVVTHDVPAGMTAGGVPAKVIGANKHPEYIQNKYPFGE